MLESLDDEGPRRSRIQTDAMFARGDQGLRANPVMPRPELAPSASRDGWPGGGAQRKLGLEAPVKLLGLAVVLMGGDYVYARP